MADITEKDAFQLIETMIASAKKEVRDNGFYFMLWGWLVFVASIIDFLLVRSIVMPQWYEQHAVVWAILMPLGGIISGIDSARSKKKIPRVKSYVDELMSYAVRAFVISLFIICFIMPFTQNWRAFYPVLLIVYAIWLYIAGGALRFKPLIFGGYANWLFAIIAFFMAYDIQLLLLAAAVLLGYIIPGHLLKANFNKQHVQGT